MRATEEKHRKKLRKGRKRKEIVPWVIGEKIDLLYLRGKREAL